MSKESKSSLSTLNPDDTLPPGWPEDVPLPTLEEAEEADRKIIEGIARLREDYRKKSIDLTEEDMRRIVFTI